MNVCLFLIVLGIITVQGAQPENQQEKSINAKRFREPEPCARVKGAECIPRPMDSNVWPCPSFICPMNHCSGPQLAVCCCPGNDWLDYK
ncbi:small cysteine-rich protein 8-like [Orbicella faveolata]|uniref:small cysteine-rich protein 8-like n=1 Tax=Orbicella faveolata TaxID=48498 RepID=UPI0009E4D4F4|nr:small cysteine-rich protein 8-like [Orbicella faveolata]XP_020617595.1 small cysteine-rich protein 8-like [Orbicella faveolata]